MRVVDVGLLGYEAARTLQSEHRQAVQAGAPDVLLLLEHPPIVTLGRRGGLVDAAALDRQQTPVITTRRGGLAPWHGPGQLVGYPVVHLGRARLNVPGFVRALGELMVGICADLGVTDVRYDACRPGVYRQGRKLGSIGLHIHREVTAHGFALNISNRLDGFAAITPCGEAELQVSSLQAEGATGAQLSDAVSSATARASALLGPR